LKRFLHIKVAALNFKVLQKKFKIPPTGSWWILSDPFYNTRLYIELLIPPTAVE